jgi:hypothetical protein
VLKSRLVSTITAVVSTLLPMKVTYAQFHWITQPTQDLWHKDDAGRNSQWQIFGRRIYGCA